ncbi:hypothetical protein L7F22_018861 [Adiantum nelumboides]|nr:hypothetical protein [Adiantum nelumboides]
MAAQIWTAPAWLGEFLAADFKCTKKVRDNVFCTACRQVLKQEQAEAHALTSSPQHRTLQVGKSSNVLSLRVSQLAEGSKENLLNVEGIQQYHSNGHIIVYLHQRLVKGYGAVPRGPNRPINKCRWCPRLLMDAPGEGVDFCSLECKWRLWLDNADVNVLQQPRTDGEKRSVG